MADRLVETIREKPNPNLAGQARESVGKRKFIMTEDASAADPERRKTLLEDLGAKQAKRL